MLKKERKNVKNIVSYWFLSLSALERVILGKNFISFLEYVSALTKCPLLCMSAL